MAGNAFQWNEALINSVGRGIRGGSFAHDSGALPSSFRGSDYPMSIQYYLGFRVASIPEPSTGVLAVLACGLMWWKRRSFRRVA